MNTQGQSSALRPERVKVVTLLENAACREGLASAHGLSLYLETPRHRILFDMGPDGAFAENAAALGVDAVLVTPECYDPLYRRAVRVSMGTVFQVPWTRIGEEADPRAGKGAWAKGGLPLLHELGFATAAMALSDDSVPLDDARLAAEPKLALVFGTEGDGLAPTTIAACDYTVRIPMQHHVDSLNVAAASAVAFWELRR